MTDGFGRCANCGGYCVDSRCLACGAPLVEASTAPASSVAMVAREIAQFVRSPSCHEPHDGFLLTEDELSTEIEAIIERAINNLSR